MEGNMNEFELALDDCVRELTKGSSTLEQCLARYPQHSAQLKSLLDAGVRLQQGRELRPSAAFKESARAKLMDHAHAHPRRPGKSHAPILLRMMVGIAALLILFLATGTAFAQDALPGGALYPWKLSSERAWRAISPDPVNVDLQIADRRADELIVVYQDQGREATALTGYHDALNRLEADNNAKGDARILQTLDTHHDRLTKAGITVPELDQIVERSKTTKQPNPSVP